MCTQCIHVYTATAVANSTSPEPAGFTRIGRPLSTVVSAELHVLSLVRRLKHTVLPYNYLYMYACLCARAAWCREGLNTGRKKLFTARPGPIFRLGAKVLSLVLLQKNQKNKTKKNKKKVLYGRNSYWNGIYRYFSKIFTMCKSYVIFRHSKQYA